MSIFGDPSADVVVSQQAWIDITAEAERLAARVAEYEADIETKVLLIQDLCAMQKEHENQILALRARVADHETYRDFWRRHAMPPLATPSCLVCGRVPGDWPPAIQHMALPSVIVCTPCVEASRTAGNKPV